MKKFEPIVAALAAGGNAAMKAVVFFACCKYLGIFMYLPT